MEIEIVDAHTGEIVRVPTIADAEQHLAERTHAVVRDIYVDTNNVCYFVCFSSEIPF